MVGIVDMDNIMQNLACNNNQMSDPISELMTRKYHTVSTSMTINQLSKILTKVPCAVVFK